MSLLYLKYRKVALTILLTGFMTVQAQQLPYQNPSLGFHERAKDLVSRLSVEEKASQMGNMVDTKIDREDFSGVGRVILPVYQYWNEAIHGVARSGAATSFPVSKAMSATWDRQLVFNCATVISDEARIYNNLYSKGLNYWCPTINMSRDPRWGRDEENYGEDPFLAGTLAVQFVKGLQGEQTAENPYLKTVACAKHFAANNYEQGRQGSTSFMTEHVLREYYLPAFEMCVKEGRVQSIMSSYNALSTDLTEKNAVGIGWSSKKAWGGKPNAMNDWLLTRILRDEWGFSGYVTSDCAGVSCIYRPVKHAYFGWYDEHDSLLAADYQARATALAIRAGNDMNCEFKNRTSVYQTAVEAAIDKGYMTEADLDTALVRVLESRFALGEFDADVPWRNIAADRLECADHQALALEAARESIVLLKNEGGLLPLSDQQTVALIGPYADKIILGDYSGTPTHTVTPFKAVSQRLNLPDAGLQEEQGRLYMYATSDDVNTPAMADQIAHAVEIARKADVVVFLGGTNYAKLADHATGTESHDRWQLTLPGNQEQVLKAVYEANPHVVLVLESNSSLDITWAKQHLPAILCAWYGGQAQGQAVCDVLYGDYNPCGKLTSTWYNALSELPSAVDSQFGAHGMLEYNIDEWGYTYMYYGRSRHQSQSDKPMYPFGYGQSYTTFAYSDLQLSSTVIGMGQTVSVSATIKNTGTFDGAEVVQLYVSFPGSGVSHRPVRKLVGFERVALKAGESKTITMPLSHDQLAYFDEAAHSFCVEAGTVNLYVSASSADDRLTGTIRAEASMSGVGRPTF